MDALKRLALVSAAVAFMSLALIGPTSSASPKDGGTLKKSPRRAAAPLLQTPNDENMKRLLFFATLEGLYTDGVTNDVVDEILRYDPKKPNTPHGFSQHFVYACPICMPAYEAFRAYRERKPFYGNKKKQDTLGAGLPKELRDRLLSSHYDTRVQALAELTRDWVDRKFRSMRLTDAERAAWTAQLERGRELGLQYLLWQLTGTKRKLNKDVAAILASAKGKDQLIACPFCDGAVCSLDERIDSMFFDPTVGFEEPKKKAGAKE